MYRAQKQRKYIIVVLFFILIVMSGAYAAFQSNLKIKGTTRITSLWDVRITNVTAGTPTGSAENAIAPTWDKLIANMEANLYEKGDAMEYDVTITNNGTVDAILSDIIGTPSNSEAVIITFSGYAKGEKLYKKGHEGNTKVVHVKIAYNPEYDGGETSGEANVEFNFTQGEGGDIDPGGDKYLIAYNYAYNGGASSQAVDEYVESGTTVTLNKTATKPGWTFVGWNTNKNATTGLASIVVSNNTTVYAIYSKTLTATYQKSENVESISKTSDSCTIYNLQTGCNKTLPTITPKPGYTSDTWYNGTEVVGHGGDTYELKNNVTLTTAENTNKYQVVYNYSENGGTSATKTEDSVDYNANIDLTPIATKAGWTFVGWNTDKDATTKLDSLKMGTTDVTLYAIYRKEAVTLTAKFNANGATLSSTANKTCTLAAVYNKATQATSCDVTAPTITASTNTPTVVGFNTSASATTNNEAYNSSTGKLALTASNDNNTWYAITKKDAVTLTAKFNANGATLSSTANKTCTLAATYKGEAQATSCTVDAPTITAPANTPIVVGFNTSASSTTNNSAYSSSTKKITLTASNNNKTWYAITKKDAVTLTAKWNPNGATLSSTDNKTCTLAAAYNNAVQATSCTVDAPTITAPDNTPIVVGFNTTANATTNNEAYNLDTKKLTLTASNDNNTWSAITKNNAVTLTAKWNANGAALSFTTDKTCTIAASYNGIDRATSCTVDAPTITASANTPTVVGFNTSPDATTNNSAYNLNTGKLTLNSDLNNKTWSAITRKDAVTLTASWDPNGAELSSTDDKTCTLAATYKGAAQATSCTVDAPTITPSANTPTIVGFNTSPTATTNNSAYNLNTGKLTLNDSNNNSVWSAITKKDSVVRHITFNPNGNTSFTYDGTRQTTTKTYDLCTIEASYAGVAQDNTCSATITIPTIEANSNTPTLIGWSNGATNRTAAYTSGQNNVNIVASSDLTYYAQTTKAGQTFTLTYSKGTGVSTMSKTSDSCTIEQTYNGASQASNCTVTLPTFTVENGYTKDGFYNGNTKVDNDGETINVNSNLSLTAKANANIYEITLDGGDVQQVPSKVYYQYNTTKKINNVTCYYYTDSALTTCLSGGYNITPPSKDGYTFGGYYTGENGAGTQYVSAAGAFINNVYQTVGNKTLHAKWTANAYTINYTLNGGTKGTNGPTSGTYDSNVQISNPTKKITVTGNANGSGATIGSATSANQTFAGWTSANLGENAVTGTTSSPATPWDGSSTKNTYFKNLANSGSVTMVANWTPVSFNLPTVSKSGYACTWNTEEDGSGTSYNSGASYTPGATASSNITLYAICGDVDKPASTITGGTTQKSTGQTLTLKCTDTVGVTGYYWGTTEPTSASAITTTTAADLEALQGSGLSKTGITNGTYYLGCKDAENNIDVSSITIRKYVVNNLLETVAGTTGTYTNANYTSASTQTYYIKKGTKITLTSAYTIPTGASSGTFKGYSKSYSATAVSPTKTNPTVAPNNTTTYYMWFNRNTYDVTITKPTNGSITAETVGQTGNSVEVENGASADGTLTVKYGDTVKATATGATGYSLTSWSGGYVSGSTNPVTGGNVTAAKTITATFGDSQKPVPKIGNGIVEESTSQTLTLKCTDNVGVTGYYFGTTQPTSASQITTTTAADLETLQGSWLIKDGITNGTYYLGCKDAAGNFEVTSVTIRKYVVNNLLETLAGETGTYTSANYESVSTQTYYIKSGTEITLTKNRYSSPSEAAFGDTYKGYSTSYSATAASLSTTNPTVADNDTTTYYRWFNRSKFNVTVSKPTNGTITAETVTQPGNSVTASAAAATLSVKYGDTVKATATPATGYSLSSWSGGYVSGTTNPVIGTEVTYARTITGTFADTTKPVVTISGGTTQKSTGQTLTLKCTDNAVINGYYWGTTEPTSDDEIGRSATADLEALQGDGLVKTGITNGTYYFGCRDRASNFDVTSITIRKYQIQSVLETIAGTTGTYTSANYEDVSSSLKTYYLKDGATINLAGTYEVPTGAASGTFKGYSTSYSTTAVTPSTTNPTVASNDTTTYYMWFNRNKYNVTVSKPTNGTITAETVGQTGNSVTASTAAATLSVKYGDTVKATATAASGYSLSSWSGGYVSGATNPITGGAVTAAKTITGTFAANDYTITIASGTGVSSLTASGWTGTGTESISKTYHIGDVIDLTDITPTYKNGYTGLAYSKTSGEGTLSGNSFTVGAGTSIISFKATGLNTPTCTMQGGATKVYNQSATTLTATDVSSNYDTDSVDITYTFGEAPDGSYSLGNYGAPGASNTLLIAKDAFRDTRFYGVEIVVTDKLDNTITSTCTSGTNSSETYGTTVANRTTMKLVNSRIRFDATTNGGTLTGTNPLYVSYQGTAYYAGRTSTLVRSLPTVNAPVGYTFNGWYTAASGGSKVINADGTLTGTAVSGWTNASKQWVKTSTTNLDSGNTLYAQYTANTYTINYNLNGGNNPSTKPSSGTYNQDVQISNPTKTITVTGDANGSGATVGNSTSKAQTFAGWTSTTIGQNAKTGTAANPSTAWSGTTTKNTYFKNLNESGTVTMVANWTPVAFNLPTVSKTGYTCTWNTEADGSGTSYNSGASYTPESTTSSSVTLYAICGDTNKPSSSIVGGTTLKQTSQSLTLKCTDTAGVAAYYWGTTEPTSASAITTTTAADLTALQGSGFSKTGITKGTYYLGCKDADGNFDVSTITIREYKEQNVLETIAGTTGTYTSANYEKVSSSLKTYYVKDGTTLTLSSAGYNVPTEGNQSGKFKGYTTSAPSTTAQTPSTTAPKITNDTTTYYMWFNRNTYNVTITKPVGGSVKAETTTKTGNSVTASTAAATLSVKYGDKVKATATPSNGYIFGSWAGGYISGMTTPTTGGTVTAAKTITGYFVGTPTFEENAAGEVTITYPSGCSSPYVCKYKIGTGSEVSVTSSPTTISVGEDETVIATASNGNSTSATYTVIRNDLYVKSDGSDTTGYGTVAHPYATIARAYNAATDTRTSTIYVMDNITESSGASMNASKDIILTSSDTSGVSGTAINTVTRSSSYTGVLYSITTGSLSVNNLKFDGNNVSSTYGAFMISANPTLELNSGVRVYNFKSSNPGGGITSYLDETYTGATIILNGAYISSNSAPNGGGIYVSNGTNLIMNGNSHVSINSTSGSYGGSGGGIYGDSGSNITINDGIFYENGSSVNGGAIYTAGTLNITGGSIEGNGSVRAGAIYATSTATTTISGGTIGGINSSFANTASNGPGAIENYGTFNMTGGTISYNSGAAGGAMFNGGTAHATITGGSITNNSSTGYKDAAGGIFNAYGCTMTLGGTITINNNTAYLDGNIYNMYADNINNDGRMIDNTTGYWNLNSTNTFFHIFSKKNTNFVLDVDHGVLANTTNVDIWTAGTGDNQNFSIRPYKVINGKIYYVIAVFGEYTVNNYGNTSTAGTSVKLWEWSRGIDGSLWSIEDAGSGYWNIKSYTGNLCLDVFDGNMAAGTDVIVWPCNSSSDNQKWAFAFIKEMRTDTGQWYNYRYSQ